MPNPPPSTALDHEAILGAPPEASVAKSVYALAIQPLRMPLSVTGRKAYDVMLWYAQRLEPDEEGGFSCPVSSILKSAGSNTTSTNRLQRYIEQMVQTSVIWRPLSPSEQQGLFDPDVLEPEPQMEGEVRTFTLLAEARRSYRGGQAWVTWFYPPTIRKQLVNPERWAQLQIASIAKLSTYSAVALYEICARYKTAPGGLTSRHPPEFWVSVLREGGDIKPMDYRHFKSRMLKRDIAEINAETEIQIELIEHRASTRGREIVAVQFRVEKSGKASSAGVAVNGSAAPVSGPVPVDDMLAIQASRHNIREADVDLMVAKYGLGNVQRAIDYMDTRKSKRGAQPIYNPTHYLRHLLNQKSLSWEDGGGSDAGASGVAVEPTPEQRERALDQQRQAEQENIKGLWIAHRKAQLKEEFSRLRDDEQREYLRRTLDSSESLRNSPSARKRIAQGEWKSPLVFHYVIALFAKDRLGESWMTPTARELAEFAASVEDENE